MRESGPFTTQPTVSAGWRALGSRGQVRSRRYPAAYAPFMPKPCRSPCRDLGDLRARRSRFRRPALCLLAALSLSPVFAHPGVGIVMDGRGQVYYTDLARVWRIAPDGTRSVAVPGVHTHELCLDAAGNLYGEHLWYNGDAKKTWGYRIWRLAPDRTLSEVIPAREGFRTDYSFVRDARGTMYWADHDRGSVLKRAPDGPIEVIVKQGILSDPRWMTATDKGVLYLVDGNDLRRITPDGIVTTLANNLGRSRLMHVSATHALMGVWTDREENAYVAIYGERVVRKVTPDGKATVAARSTWPWSPTGGLIAPNGDLWLLESSVTNAARVRRIAKDGSSRTY